MVRDGDPVIPLGVGVGAGGVKHAVRLGPGVEKPEGDIEPLNFLQVVVFRKGPGQQDFPPVMVFQGRLRRFLIQPEGNEAVRLQGAVELSRNDGVVAAVGTGGGGGGFLGNQLGAAGGAVVDPHSRRIFPPVLRNAGQVPLRVIFPGSRFFRVFREGFLGSRLLFGVQCFHF